LNEIIFTFKQDLAGVKNKFIDGLAQEVHSDGVLTSH
jgi:hypothetical protein